MREESAVETLTEEDAAEMKADEDAAAAAAASMGGIDVDGSESVTAAAGDSEAVSEVVD